MFKDRREAGGRLAEALLRFRMSRPVILGLPRGGVPVAREVANALGAPLDVLVVRKLGAPRNREFGVGAVGEGGREAPVILDERSCRRAGLSGAEIQQLVAAEHDEVQRRVLKYRGRWPMLSIAGRTVIVVDDGLATGVTAEAAVAVIRRLRPAQIIVAVPTGSLAAIARLRRLVDEVICLESPEEFNAVGAQYVDFPQVSDGEVTQYLGESFLGDSDIPIDHGRVLPGRLEIRPGASAVVIFAHGTGSSRMSPRNSRVAFGLRERGLGTLVFDLLTSGEVTGRSVEPSLDELSSRLLRACSWVKSVAGMSHMPLALFGSSSGAAVALKAAVLGRPHAVTSIVSRGGRPDLVAQELPTIDVPTMFIAGGRDEEVLRINRKAQTLMHCESRIEVIPEATHLFVEEGALEVVSTLTYNWVTDHLGQVAESQAEHSHVRLSSAGW